MKLLTATLWCLIALAAPKAAIAEIKMESLLDAIRQVESGGNASAIGDNGKAVGAYQLHKIFVREVNRISGKSFKATDRLVEAKSREMVKIWLTYRLGRGDSVEAAVRRYNGGSNWQGKAAEKYWQKIKAEMEK